MLNCVIVDIILLGHQCTDHEGEGLYDFLLTILPIPYDFFRDPISSLLNCDCLSRFLDVKALVTSRCFQPGEGPSLLRDCENRLLPMDRSQHQFRPYLLLGGIFVTAAVTKLTASGRRHNALSDLSSVAPHPLFSLIQRNQISRQRTRTKIEITSVLSRLDIQISIHHIIYETNYFCSRVEKANCSVRSGFTKYQIASSSCGRLKKYIIILFHYFVSNEHCRINNIANASHF